ncbi:MAG: TraB/GumN family protein [Candidatus Methanospirareceae archaeon]
MSIHNSDNILLVGTGHVLEKSVKEVEEVIEREKPDVVAVELCEARYKSLKGEVGEVSPREVLSGGSPFLTLTHWLLAYAQRKMGAELGVEPGADMLAAITKAEELGCKIALIDRPVQITMQRFWTKMRFWEKLKMLLSIIFSIASIGRSGAFKEGGVVEDERGDKKIITGNKGMSDAIELDRLTDEDVVTQLVKEVREFSPGAATAILDERDAYIARSLLELQTASRESGKIVAVVGAGHVTGIKKFLSHPELLPTKEELCALPKKRKMGMWIGICAAFLIILLASLFTGISLHVLLRAFLWWFIINGVLSAAGVVIAGGHPLSAITAFSVAWLTSLNPFLAAGWFAGLAEAHFRRPSMEDAKNMLNVDSLRELMSNRLFKVILVAALANIGSIAGTFIGLYLVGQVLGIDMHQIWIGLKSMLGRLSP